MLYLISGNDPEKKLPAHEAILKGLPKGAEVFSISRNNFDPGRIESFYSGTTLFSEISAVIFEGILEREEARDFILPLLPYMEGSKNHFIFLEGKLGKPVLDAFKKARAKIEVFDQPKEKKERFDTFSIANAFAAKNKFNAWVLFRQAMAEGVSLEELVGVLFWKMKDMILKKNLGKFSEGELKNLAARISYLVPEARREGRDAEAAFEKFLLEAF